MIRFEMVCDAGHSFEGWFTHGEACEDQLSKGEIECPVCGSCVVQKALMAPAIKRHSAEPRMNAEEARMVAALRRKYDPNGRWVGDEFAQEVRRGGFGKSALFGMATQQEYDQLIDDGYQVAEVSGTETEMLN